MEWIQIINIFPDYGRNDRRIKENTQNKINSNYCVLLSQEIKISFFLEI